MDDIYGCETTHSFVVFFGENYLLKVRISLHNKVLA